MEFQRWKFFLWLHLLISLVSARCRFPEALQSHAASSWWLYHVTSGGARTSEDTLYYVEFLNDKMLLTPVSGNEAAEDVVQTTKECITHHANDTFIVRSFHDKKRYYCLRFLFRSDTVFQMETSDPYLRADDTSCKDLHLDPWPILRYDTTNRDHRPCPLIGGFQLSLTDLVGQSFCDSYVMSPRFENSCDEQEGLVLKLEHCKAARSVLDMNSRQKLVCLADWRDSRMGRVIITKREDAAFFWMIAIKETDHSSRFTGFISSDIVLDENRRYKHSVLLTLERKVFISTCADLAQECGDIKNQTCVADNLVLEMLCAESCNRCARDTSEIGCTFPPYLQGSWLGFSSTEKFNLTVTESKIFAGERQMICKDRDALLDTYTLVSFRDDGCYPEYKCLKVRRIYNNILRFDYEGGPSWPVFLKDRLCTPYMTNNDVRHLQQMSLAFKSPNDDNVTSCEIPPGTFESEVVFGDGNVCVAFLSRKNCSEDSEEPDVIGVYFGRCSLGFPSGQWHIEYTCVMQLPTNDPERRMALVQTNNQPSTFFCWLYDPPFKTMVVLPASKCYDHQNSDILMTHSIKSTSETCMHGLPLTTTTSLAPPTTEMTSRSFYDVMYEELDQFEDDYKSEDPEISDHAPMLNFTVEPENTTDTKFSKSYASFLNAWYPVFVSFIILLLGKL